MANGDGINSSYKGWVIGLLTIIGIGIAGTLTERLTTRRAEVNFREKMYNYMHEDTQEDFEVKARLKDLEIHAKKTHEELDDIQQNGCMSYQRWVEKNKEKNSDE